MSETQTQPAARPIPVLRRMVRPGDRDFGLPTACRPPSLPAAAIEAKNLTRNERRILLALLAAIDPNGRVAMTSRGDLRTSANVMQAFYYSGWVNGAGSPDARGQGNTPESSWWWLTTRGEHIARAINVGKAK